MIQSGSTHEINFGNRTGNFQSRGTSYEHILATGGQVSNKAIAVSSINNMDGVGVDMEHSTQ